jgi:nucleoside 2-deoxyribosyltransferase
VSAAPRPRCYVASPLGFTEAGRHYYRGVLLPALAQVVDPVDPWALSDPREVERARSDGRERQMALEIGRRNMRAIASSPLLAALLDGQEPDSGTVAEVGYAAGLGKRCFAVRSDLRDSGEPGVSVNLQLETLIIESGGVLAGSLAELVQALAGAARDAATL